MQAAVYIGGGRKEVPFRLGKDLLQVLSDAGITTGQQCAGLGICGKCKIRIGNQAATIDDAERALLTPDEVSSGVRLACRYIPAGGEVVTLISDYLGVGKVSKPYVNRFEYDIDGWPGTGAGEYVIAIDLGSTSIAGYLLSQKTGRIVSSATRANRQAAFGADVMSRLAYASRSIKKGRDSLKKKTLSDIAELITDLVNPGIKINHAVAVMNPAMETFLLGADPNDLGRHPYETNFTTAKVITPFKAAPLAGIPFYIPPVVGGYVGSDLASALYATLDTNPKPPFALLDLGTNAEVALVTEGGAFACSTAAGPAFEGAGIKHGMRAIRGAIEEVTFDKGNFIISVAGGGIPEGICGSGMFSLVGELLRNAAMDAYGSFVGGNFAQGVIASGRDGKEIMLSSDITVSENDVQKFLLAKAAVRAALETLMVKSEISAKELSAVHVCGAFATMLDPFDLILSGLIPDIDPDKVRYDGNSAATGAAMMASSKSAFDEVCILSRTVEHVPLAADGYFQNRFLSEVGFHQ